MSLQATSGGDSPTLPLDDQSSHHSAIVADMARSLLTLSSRACCLARLVRSEPELFNLLVEEKTGAQRNARFARDFKTLADVLIQEMVRHELEQKFPAVTGSIFGEESNKFSSSFSGDNIAEQTPVLISVNGDQNQLENALTKVLEGNSTAAGILTKAVYGEYSSISSPAAMNAIRRPSTQEQQDKINSKWSADLEPLERLQIDMSEMGVWVDPIDGTNVYIFDQGRETDTISTGGISRSSLSCVTVLIGIFNKKTGKPVLGVVGKPFSDASKENPVWLHSDYWGFTGTNPYGGGRLRGIGATGSYFYALGHTIPSLLASPAKVSIDPVVTSSSSSLPSPKKPFTVVASHSEINSPLFAKLSAAGCRMIPATGAGYKQLCVILGLADIYLGTQANTYQWDTCAPHAILRAQGGGIVGYKDMLPLIEDILNVPGESSTGFQDGDRRAKLEDIQLLYTPKKPGIVNEMGEEDLSPYCNSGGLVAYRSIGALSSFLSMLQGVSKL